MDKNQYDIPRAWSDTPFLFKFCGIENPGINSACRARFQHIKIKAGKNVIHSNDQCDQIFIVYSGFFKTMWSDKNGTEKVLGFPMKKEILGLDGIAKSVFVNSVKALTDGEVIAVPRDFIFNRSIESELFRNHMFKVLSQQIINEQKTSFLGTSLSADARVAKFLLSLSFRFKNLGYSEKQFYLRMTREDIGSHLGVTLETVSRTLSALNKIGLINLDQRSIELIDFDKLKSLRRLPGNLVRERKNSDAENSHSRLKIELRS